jgi:hypothetical protein
MMNNEEKCLVTLTREVLLKNPDLLKSLFSVCDGNKLIDWILKKNASEDALNEEEENGKIEDCENSCDSCLGGDCG